MTETKAEAINGFFGAMQEPLAKYKESLTEKLGFNAFSMVADQYRKENFHSDILRNILDPSSPHGEGCLFLRLFLDYLVKAAEEVDGQYRQNLVGTLKTLNLDKEFITVRREEARTDIAIVHEKKNDNNDNWAIIIESKMNGAGDMDRQLPRYFDYWHKKLGNSSDAIKAILYLNAGAIRYPDQSTWEENDPQNVNPLLIPIVGYSKEEPNLVTDWLEKCILSSDSFDAKAVLSQYTRILKKQAGDFMENEPDFAAAMWNHGLSCKDLQDFISAYPSFIAKTIQSKLLDRYDKKGIKLNVVMKKEYIHLYNEDTVYFDWDGKQGYADYRFAIDILCKTSNLTLSFFIRSSKKPEEGIKKEIIEGIKKGIKKGNNIVNDLQFEKTSDYKNGRWLTTIELPINSTKQPKIAQKAWKAWNDEISKIVDQIVEDLLNPLADVTQFQNKDSADEKN